MIRYYQKLKFEYKFLENKERLMTISRVEAAEQDQLDEKSILEKEIGFSRIIWELSRSVNFSRCSEAKFYLKKMKFTNI